MLDDRKGFEWWWMADDFSDESRDEIFKEILEIINSPRPPDSDKCKHGIPLDNPCFECDDHPPA
jgi:hypothetical protein